MGRAGCDNTLKSALVPGHESILQYWMDLLASTVQNRFDRRNHKHEQSRFFASNKGQDFRF